MDTEPGLRERKKSATKQALHEAAVRLALRDGYEQLTVEAIADAAMVSRRTFSNYFASKEEALVHNERVRLAQLLDTVAARPEQESPWTALMASIRERMRERSPDADPAWMDTVRLLRSHPSLLSEQLATFGSFERDLAVQLDRRTPQNLRSATRSRVLAGCFLAALRVGTQAWLDDPGAGPLTEFAEQALAEAGEALP